MKSELLAGVVSAALAMPAFALTPPPSVSNGGAATASAVPAAGLSAPSALAPTPSVCCRVAAGTVVDVELAEPVNTRRQKRGDHFALRLAEPLVIDGKMIVPAGAAGSGEVVDAANGGIGGRPAKLILAARYIDYDGARVTLHGFRLGGGGHDNSNLGPVVN